MPDYRVRAAVTEGGDPPVWSPSTLSFTDCDAFVFLDDAAPPFQFDLAETTAIESTEGMLRVSLLERHSVQISGMGRTEGEIVAGFLRAVRDRTAKAFRFGAPVDGSWHLGEVAADGSGPPGHAAFRLYRSLLGIIPMSGDPAWVHYADIRRASFDEGSYRIVLDCHAGPAWRLGKLGQRTTSFLGALKQAMMDHSSRYQTHLKNLIPDVSASLLHQVSSEWREGLALPAKTLEGAVPGLVNRILDHLAAEDRRPFLAALRQRAEAPALGAYFSSDADAAESGSPPFVPFGLFPLKGRNAIAWETMSSDTLATYVFHGGTESLGSLNNALRDVRFAREPIYIPEDELKSNGELRHHVVLLRRSAALQLLRERFACRAIHSDPETYAAQLERLSSIQK